MWTITWSWQAPGRIAAMAAAEGGMVISSGLDLFMLEVDSTVRWHQIRSQVTIYGLIKA